MRSTRHRDAAHAHLIFCAARGKRVCARRAPAALAHRHCASAAAAGGSISAMKRRNDGISGGEIKKIKKKKKK